MDSLFKNRALGLSILLAILAFGLDRAHKYFQVEMTGWRGGEFVPVTPFFDYVLVWNTGVSYGLLDGMPIAVLFGVMSLAALLIFVWWWRAREVLVRAGLALALGGAASHFVDRIIYGAVPDFFHFHWGEWSFYIFNISDTMITIGVALLLLDVVTGTREKRDQS